MVQLRTQRTALSLYAVLLVLPTLVLGFLQWHHIVVEKEAALAAVPRDAEDAARRFREGVKLRLHSLVDNEQNRPWRQYAYYFLPETGESTPVVSPLFEQTRQQGLLGWFVFDMSPDPANHGGGMDDHGLEVFGGAQSTEDDDERMARETDLRLASNELMLRFLADTPLKRANRMGPETQTSRVPVAVLLGNRATRADLDSFTALSQQVQDDLVPMSTTAFHLQFYQEGDGTPRIVATRRVFSLQQMQFVGAGELLHEISRGLDMVQGFFIDPGWLFRELPERIASNVLAEREHFLGVGETCCNGENEYRAQIHLVSDLDLETYAPEEKDFGPMNIVIDTAEVEQRFRATAWRFFGVAAMLALSLSTGMFLVWRSIRSDLDQAQRTENFVAAVTHELRTPLASIKMHGEMLLDGWAKEPAKQTEYYRRIVRETERLSTLVERVLEKSRLASGSTRPEAGDLSSTVGSLREELLRWSEGEHPDLELRLANDLPPVMLTAEAVRSIVTNLVENARKYAPVDFQRADAEPIVVQTKRADEGAVLEVLDRGPGIAPAERERIFQAFYRVGNEATRTSRGTGLGLHLVALQAAALGGKATVRGRDGGGSIFSVTFPAAPPDHA